MNERAIRRSFCDPTATEVMRTIEPSRRWKKSSGCGINKRTRIPSAENSSHVRAKVLGELSRELAGVSGDDPRRRELVRTYRRLVMLQTISNRASEQ